jgi:large subunit ribosomal protein L1
LTAVTFPPFSSRQFSTSLIALARQHKSKINVPSKKALAAKAKRRAAKAPKHIYHREQMPLTDAIAILRVASIYHFPYVAGLTVL